VVPGSASEAGEGVSQAAGEASEERRASDEDADAQPVLVPPEVPDVPEGEAEHQSSYLEEQLYPTTSSEAPLEVGSEHLWGDATFVVEAVLAGGWYRARQRETGELALLRPEPGEEVWSRLPNHRLLPKVLYNGPEGFAASWPQGEVLSAPLPLEETLDHVLALAQLVRFFKMQQRAVLYLDPEGLLITESGLRVRYPPRVSPLGETLPSFYREGYTAPEVQEGRAASGKEGVYLLGALLFHLLTGDTPPPEGPSRLLLTGLEVPGLPQLLSAALAAPPERLDPEALFRAVQALKDELISGEPVFRIGAATTVGLNPDRPVNEDSYAYSQEVVKSHTRSFQLLRACVADGMGGEAAGEVASRAAVETFCSESPPHPLDSAQAQAEWTVQLVWKANQAVLDAMSGQDGGCTFTGAILVGSRLSLAHVGDTRAYLYRAQGLMRLTRDHSLVDALLASGMITEAEAQRSPDRHKVLRSLGSVRQRQEGYIDTLSAAQQPLSITLEPGEGLLLISDGVWGELKDEQVNDLAKAQMNDPRALAEALVQEALRAGAPDNATAVVVLRTG